MESGRKDVLGCEDRALPAPFLLLGFVDLEGGSRYNVFPWPFLEPTPSLLLSRAPPYTCWANILPEKGHQESQVGGNPPEDCGLESEIMGLGSRCIL